MADTFPGVIAFAFMVSLLVLGTALRARLPVLQAFLIPASLIGGVIGFVLVSMGWSFGYMAEDFVGFTFHFFTLSFISLCLTAGPPNNGGQRKIVTGGLWLTMVWTASLVLQGLIGLAVIRLYNGVAGTTVDDLIGLLVAHGYTQGPGQALAYATIWQSEYGIANAVSVGLIYASLGFLTAFAIGIPVARWAVRRGLNVNRQAAIGTDFLRGLYDPSTDLPAGRQITHQSNVDTLAYHIGLIGIVYLLTDLWLKTMQGVSGDARFLGAPLSILFSYNLFFVHGLCIALIVRRLIDLAGLGRYLDRGTQNTITGASVDIMVIATVMSIKLAVLAALLVPILLVSAMVTMATAALCYAAARHGGPASLERALTAFGCCCGSTGTGLLLLRILDPDFQTPVARELAFFNVAIIFTTLHILLFMVPRLPEIGTSAILTAYGITFAVALAVLAAIRFASNRRTQTNTE